MGLEYLGILPPPLARRRLKEKHCLHKKTKGGSFVIRCSCGWFVDGLTGMPDEVEKAAYLHRTEPDLIVAGSSDVMKEVRMAQLRDILVNKRDRPWEQ